ncbi:MAG: hypothetical protein JOZ81_29355 [Chloroflexi bacterium]|nr:hypothetical protein [Chloroflexota bacterium]
MLLLAFEVPHEDVQAQVPVLSPSTWLPGPDASGAATFSGTVDQPSSPTSHQISGWVVDTTAQGWSGIDDVRIWDGLMQAGGREIAHAVFQLDRPDVAAALNNPFWAASGFSASLGTASFVTDATVYVYAHTPSKGWWYLQVTATPANIQVNPGPMLNIETPTPLATVHANSPYIARGFAFDPASTSGPGVDRVQLYLNGDKSSGIYIGDATLGAADKFAANRGPQFGNAGWQLTFQPNSWLQNINDNQLVQLTVYAHSSLTGAETQATTTIVVSVP